MVLLFVELVFWVDVVVRCCCLVCNVVVALCLLCVSLIVWCCYCSCLLCVVRCCCCLLLLVWLVFVVCRCLWFACFLFVSP